MGKDVGTDFRKVKRKVTLILPDSDARWGVRAVHARYTRTIKGRIKHYIFNVVKDRRLTEETKEYPESGDILAVHRYDKRLKLEKVAAEYVSSESRMSDAELKAAEEDHRKKEAGHLKKGAERRKEVERLKADRAKEKRIHAIPNLRSSFTHGTVKIHGGQDMPITNYIRGSDHLQHAINKDRSGRHNFAKMDPIEERR